MSIGSMGRTAEGPVLSRERFEKSDERIRFLVQSDNFLLPVSDFGSLVDRSARSDIACSESRINFPKRLRWYGYVCSFPIR